jgi:superfamily II DNA/RNA helicase
MNPVRRNGDHPKGDRPHRFASKTPAHKGVGGKFFGTNRGPVASGGRKEGGGRSPSTGGRSFGGGGRKFGGKSFGNRGGGGKGKRFAGAKLDTSRFVNKAKEFAKPIVYVPKHEFTGFGFSADVEKNVVGRGYKTPTPIQDQAIPHILLGTDVIGIANTGTGKTAAFLLPLIEKIVKARNEKVIIIVPTRELALQIDMELRLFVKGMGIPSVTCIGGSNIREQMRALRSRFNFVTGTPGRLKDLMERKCLHMEEFKTVVLDEADRMLDMGFITDIKFLLKGMPYERHSLFFSATFSSEIEKLVGGFLKDPIKIYTKTGDTAASVDQDIVRVASREKKIEVLHDMLSHKDFEKVLIFGQTKWGVEKLSNELVKRGFKSASIHGNKTQGQRKMALGLFKENKVNILVATDVASRGLDIDDVSHVINYDLPATYEDYTHRVGRTGRAGKKGKAITFVE